MKTITRRSFNKLILTGLAARGSVSLADSLETGSDISPAAYPLRQPIADELIRTGLEKAIIKTLLPAASQQAYPGHFTATRTGEPWPREVTWPGLDAWESTGAYLLLGHEQIALDSFDFIQASQRADGNIPWAILSADSKPEGIDGVFNGARYPQDVYCYKPAPRKGQPAGSNMAERKWLAVFKHWQPKVNPLGVLAPVSYILTGWEIFEHCQSKSWLLEKINSLTSAGRYVLSRESTNGLIAGAAFYIELPPRNQWDGVTQCYAVHVFRLLAKMHSFLGGNDEAEAWLKEADKLTGNFRRIFWMGDHFAEYVHPDQGVVDFHGLTDVNWAAIAFAVATDEQTKALWPLMMKEKELWHGDMPTQLVSKPYAYRDWELNEPLSFELPLGPLYDVAASGRVWYLETLACLAMGETERLKESVRKVCRMGQRYDWSWFDRYQPLQIWDVQVGTARNYCEYPSILVRTILGNPELFVK